MVRHWLIRSEPDSYSIDDLARDKTTCWDGVRNYEARNFMRDDMRVGDPVLFYHSNADPPGVAGLAEVSREGYPDHTAWDPKDKHFDPRCDPDDPRWIMVDIAFVERFAAPVTLARLKAGPALAEMLVTKRGQRLSVQPVEKRHFDTVRRMARAATPRMHRGVAGTAFKKVV